MQHDTSFGICISNGTARQHGHAPSQNNQEGVAALIECLNAEVLPCFNSAQLKHLERFYPFGSDQLGSYDIVWDFSVDKSLATKNKVILFPDIRFHPESDNNTYIERDINVDVNTIMFAPSIQSLDTIIARYPQLQCTSKLSLPQQQKVIELITAFENKWFPFKQIVPVPPYFAVDGDNKVKLVSASTGDQLAFELGVTEFVKMIIMRQWEHMDWSGYYPLYGHIYPIPFNPPFCVGIVNDYEKLVTSIMDGKLIVMNETYEYWFSHYMQEGAIYIKPSQEDAKVSIEKAQQIRWNTVILSRYITRQCAVEYIRGVLSKLL